jgi:MoxR-like ATPase
MATQNPIEQEGTYPLPEAQVDRFMLKVKVGYPGRDEELQIMERATAIEALPAVSAVLTPAELLAARATLPHIILDEKIKRYIVDIVFATREPSSYGLSRLEGLIAWGASPRASIYLNLAARAHAFLRHHGYVDPEDIKSVAMDVLRHRVIPTYEAEAEELTSEDLVQQVLDKVEVP